MSKIVLNDVTNLNALSVINDNFDKLEQELQNKVLYRDNPEGEPNTLENDVDANGNSLYNVQDLTINGGFTVDGQDVGAYIGQAADAATDALASATAAANSATAAGASASAANASAFAADASADEAAAVVAGLAIPTGIVKGNGTAFSAAVAGTDYLAPAAIGTTVQAYDADLTTLGAGGSSARSFLGLVIGTDVQPYDADTAKTDVTQTYTAAQRGTVSPLTDGATITPDFAVANNFSVTLGGNRTLANPTNLVAGQSGVIVITQDGTGSRTLAYGSYWKFSNGTAPSLTTTASAVDVLAYYVESSSRITARLVGDVK